MWKTAGLTLLLFLTTGLICLAQNGSAGSAPRSKSPGTSASTAKPQEAKVYRHMVLFKFKEEATPEQIQEVVTDFGKLQEQIETIIGYEHGTDVSPEKLAKGFTHCFLLTFRSKTDLEAYLPHPAHQAFTVKLKPILADVLVVDYWAGT